MTWSEKAISEGVRAWLESDPSMTNEYVIARILDAAGDAQWNAELERDWRETIRANAEECSTLTERIAELEKQISKDKNARRLIQEAAALIETQPAHYLKENNSLRAKLDRAKEALEYYADQLCEFSLESEGCGKFNDDSCAGCKARAVLAELSCSTEQTN